MTGPYVVDLDDDAAADASCVGGKARGLHLLRRGGLPTPPGRVLTTWAHAAYLHDSGRAAAAQVTGNVPAPAHPGERLPVQVGAALNVALRNLPDLGAGYAVRSSAVPEDSATQSCAGLLTTRLSVPPGEVGTAVADCWASAGSSVLADYLGGATDPDGACPECAVVVQPFVAATCSAVAFTRDPIGASDALRIDIVWGRGEPLVSGTADPYSFRLDPVTLRIAPVGGLADAGLPTNWVRDLADLCLRAERLFGRPLDIEACRTEGADWLLVQARPVTTSHW